MCCITVFALSFLIFIFPFSFTLFFSHLSFDLFSFPLLSSFHFSFFVNFFLCTLFHFTPSFSWPLSNSLPCFSPPYSYCFQFTSVSHLYFLDLFPFLVLNIPFLLTISPFPVLTAFSIFLFISRLFAHFFLLLLSISNPPPVPFISLLYFAFVLFTFLFPIVPLLSIYIIYIPFLFSFLLLSFIFTFNFHSFPDFFLSDFLFLFTFLFPIFSLLSTSFQFCLLFYFSISPLFYPF